MARSTLAAAGLFASLAVLSLQAQTIDLRADVPFDFRMGDVLMPAGTYEVHHASGVVTVRNETGRPTGATTLVLSTSRKASAAQGSLEFNRYGDSYFLTKIWRPNSREGKVLPTSRGEKELRARFGLTETAGIPLKRK